MTAVAVHEDFQASETASGEGSQPQVKCFAAAMLPLGRYVREARFWLTFGRPITQELAVS
jgi:hypothetical protein